MGSIVVLAGVSVSPVHDSRIAVSRRFLVRARIVFVVRYVLDFIKAKGLSFFGWWRLIVGGIALGVIAFNGM